MVETNMNGTTAKSRGLRVAMAAACCAALAGGLWADIGPKPTTIAPGIEYLDKDMDDVTVEMTSETVNLTLNGAAPAAPEDSEHGGANELHVEVIFNMTNLGDACAFEEGFPVGHFPGNMRNFKIVADGAELPTRLIDRVTGKAYSPDETPAPAANGRDGAAPGGGGEDPDAMRNYWYIWDAAYGAKARSVRKVSYDLDIQHWSSWRYTGYILASGAAWKNPIGEAVVTLRFGKGLSADHIHDVTPRTGLEFKGDHFVWTRKNFEPKDEDNIRVHYNFAETWQQGVAAAREDAKERWSGKESLLGSLGAAARRQGRERFTDSELTDYLGALESLISDLKHEGGRWIMPAEDKARSIDVMESRSYSYDPTHLLCYVKVALDTARTYPESGKAKEVLRKYIVLGEAFVAANLYFGSEQAAPAPKTKRETGGQLDQAKALLGQDASK